MGSDRGEKTPRPLLMAQEHIAFQCFGNGGTEYRFYHLGLLARSVNLTLEHTLEMALPAIEATAISVEHDG